MNFSIKCENCGTERVIDDEFLQLGHNLIDAYAENEGDILIECMNCSNEIKSSTV